MLCSHKLPARILSRVVTALSMLPCLSVASCCCAGGNTECGKKSTAYYLDGRISSCGQVTWSCPFNSYSPQSPLSGQDSREYDCDRPCCCGNGPHTCNGVQSGMVCNSRKKPTGPARQWHSRTSIGQDYPPTSRIVGVTGWAPSITSTAARCSLLCRFLL